MENIMLQDEKKEWIKIIDFGLSNVYSEENPLKTLCGSPEYAAPELFVKGKKYGPEVDLWSFGVIVYVMSTGRLPFTSPRDESTSSDERRRRLMLQINRGLSAPQERLIVTLSAECKNLLRLALMPAAHKRIRLDELRRHPWIDAAANNNNNNNNSFAAVAADKLQLCLAERQAIVAEISTLLSMDCREVEVDVMRQRFGNIGGFYDIMSHKMQARKLEHYSRALRTTKIVKPNFEKSSNELQKKIKISAISPIIKHDVETNKGMQNALLQKKMVKQGFLKIAADPKRDVEKSKTKHVTTAAQPSSKKVIRSTSTRVQSNKVLEVKEHSVQKQRKTTKDPIKFKICQFQIKNKVDPTGDVKERSCISSLKKYSTLRLRKKTSNQNINTSEPDKNLPKPQDRVKRILRKVSAEK